MQNVKMEVVGSKLIIEVDLGQNFGPSSTGKTLIVASTQGNKQAGDSGAYVGLNVYRYPPRAARNGTSAKVDALGLD